MKRTCLVLGLTTIAAFLIAIAALEIAPDSSGVARGRPISRLVPTPAIQVASSPQSDWQPSLPLRAAFYYPWYPENWTQRGGFPASAYKPSLDFYDSSDPALAKKDIAAFEYAHIDVGIASWWGPGTRTDMRMPGLLAAARGSHVRWAVYYEQEGQRDPTVDEITSDLNYLHDQYGRDPDYLRIGGRFVVFVYADPRDGCGMADRWKQANRFNAYIVLKVFDNYTSCSSQPTGWHQYGPNITEDSQGKFGFSISPGFDRFGSRPLVPRDLNRWRQAIRDMVSSEADFQLIISFNEWGEGLQSSRRNNGLPRPDSAPI